MNRESIKIIVTGIIAVILLSIGIYAFIYRNELSGKIQDIGKKPESTEKIDRLILPPSGSPDLAKNQMEKIDMSSPSGKKDPTDKKNPPMPDSMKIDMPMDKDFKAYSDETMLPEKKSGRTGMDPMDSSAEKKTKSSSKEMKISKDHVQKKCTDILIRNTTR